MYLTNIPELNVTLGFPKVLAVRREIIHIKHIFTEIFVRKSVDIEKLLSEVGWSLFRYMEFMTNRMRKIHHFSREYNQDLNTIVKHTRDRFFPTIDLYQGLKVAIVLDFDGVIMIPDRVSIVKAIEFSILATWLQKKWFIGKITPDKFQWADKERNWYVSKAGADFMMENLDKRQSIANTINTLMLNDEHSVNDYRELGLKEYRKRSI